MKSFTYTCHALAAAFAGLLLSTLEAQAQCPVAAFCNPTNPSAANITFGIGIRNVSLGTLNHTTLANSATGTQNGYQNFSCTTGATLTAAVNYPVSITTGPNTTENVRVYIDYNNDGVFSLPTELAFSSNSALVHTGSITAPATAVLNTPLRMRVVSEFTGATALPSPCMALQYGQAEDYFIILQANTAPAQPDFTTTEPYTCDGSVSFTDLSQNAPTTWSWDFGDPGSGAGNTSAQQNPTHTFSAPGVYTVTLTSCNINGCNTEVKTNYVTYNADLPVAASCTPTTQSYCCGYGIYNVTFAGINNSSADGIAGYEDFTCPVRATVVEGYVYPLSITTSPGNNQNTAVWIDYNNDGSFSAAENVLTSLNSISPSGTVLIPNGAVLNTPLRMRVISDFAGSTLGACSNVQNGQAEDYTITIVPNTFPPIASFGLAPFSTCDTVRQFNNTTNINPSSPTTTYLWDFGDGNTSTLANPTHAYSSANGIYSVSLIACNSFGCDTASMSNFVSISNPCLNYCIPTNNGNTSQWISKVEYGSINNSSGAGANGYTNFSNISTNIVRGSTTNLTISTGSQEPRAIRVWIDFNRNGVFDQVESLFAGPSQLLPSGDLGVNAPITVPAGTQLGATRMRIIIRAAGVNPGPCLSNSFAADVEDYTVILLPPPPVIPVAAFSANQGGICTGVVSFQDQSVNQPTSWTWDFGDGSPAVTVQNPTHTYQVTSPASYTVTLTACNAAGCSTTVVPNFVVITVPCTLPYCPSNGHSNATQHIANVAMGTIANASGAAPNGYSDFTLQNTEVLIGALTPITIQLANNSVPWALSGWIDYNQNAAFDTNEQVFINQSINLPGGGYGATGNLIVPTTAVPGLTRMRIIGRQSNNSDPCVMNLISGETEDYMVNLVQVATTDVGVAFFTAPVSGCALSSTTQVCMNVQNFGTASQSNIPVRFTVGSFQSPVEIIPGPLAPGATVAYCFTATANLSASGGHTITAQTLLSADAQVVNNSKNLQVSSYPLPTPNFNHSGNGLTYTFSNTSVGATSYAWNFGDSNTSTLASPTHTFAAAGTYTVTLTATSFNGCTATTTKTLSGVSATEDELSQEVNLYPNPTAGEATITFPVGEPVTIEVYNALGQLMHRSQNSSGSSIINLALAAKGVYTVKVYFKGSLAVRKLVLQ